jgi:hypothetical protein
MLFYVYMQPEVILVARDSGPFAMQALISFLRGATQNCCLAVFEDDRMRGQIAEAVESLPEDFDRKVLKTVLSILEKRHRFLYIVKPDYTGAQDDLSCVLETADSLGLDLLLLHHSNYEDDPPTTAELCTLETYQHTNFEEERSRLANEGRTLQNGELAETDFLNRHFDKMFRYVQRIEICDRIFGRQFGVNFEYTIRTVLGWLETVIKDPDSCKLIFHIGTPQRATLEHIKTRLTAFRRGRLARLPIEIYVYDVPDPDQCLPHERFILTDQLALEIGRGMDFLDRTTHRNRDVSIGYKSMKDVQKLLNSYSGFKQPVVQL